MASFRSKYDAGLVALSFGVLAVVWRFAWAGPEASWSGVVMTALAVLATVTVLWTLCVMRYDVTATTLEVRSGPLLWKIQIASIGLVEPAREIGTAPAWSLDRLRVTATGTTLLISPRDKAGFIDALSARDSGLQRDGELLVRSARL